LVLWLNNKVVQAIGKTDFRDDVTYWAVMACGSTQKPKDVVRNLVVPRGQLFVSNACHICCPPSHIMTFDHMMS
jgi:hypothetical protein